MVSGWPGTVSEVRETSKGGWCLVHKRHDENLEKRRQQQWNGEANVDLRKMSGAEGRT